MKKDEREKQRFTKSLGACREARMLLWQLVIGVCKIQDGVGPMSGFVVACCQATKLFEAAEESLDEGI